MKHNQIKILLIMLCYILSFFSSAQQLNKDQIKSAYLYNFFKHVSWPNEQQKNTYILGVYQDEPYFKILYLSLNNKTVKNKIISVIHVNSGQQASLTDMLFIPSQHSPNIPLLAAETRSSNTLLVSDNSKNKHDIMINLSSDKSDVSIDFEVNKSNIIFEKLAMSKKLLLLGGTELDVAMLFRESELAIQVMKQREVELNLKLISQEKQLNETEFKLTKLNDVLATREIKVKEGQQKLTLLREGINEQKEALIAKELQYRSTVEQLSNAKIDLSDQQQSLVKKEQQQQIMVERIESNKQILQQQQQQLEQRNIQINKKNAEIKNRNQKIDQQQFYILLMSILIFIAVFFSLLVVLLFFKNRKTTAKLSATLSHLKDTQEQLIQSEKLASLGSLTAGVAHEINTPLGISVTATSSALEHTLEIEEKFNKGQLTKAAMKQYFDVMKETSTLNTRSVGRVINLLGNFKQVAADQIVEEKRSIDLVGYVDEIMFSLSAELKKHRVTYSYQGLSEAEIISIPGAIAQVLTNLVTNSLRHGFENKNSGNIIVKIHEQTPEQLTLVYQDDGMGMSSEVLNNIYEPFYTTKRNAGGTGLGMNIVFNIIHQKLEGSIVIKSEIEKGTEITINLPKKLSSDA